MRMTMKKAVTGCATAVWLFCLAATAGASGIVGQCADCHTMHNSEQGEAVAVAGLSGTVSTTPIQNLLRMDCIACHAQGEGKRVVTMSSGSKVPQVYHNDPEGDLAAGNFAYISGTKAGHGEASNRKGHNVIDLVDADTIFSDPPGFRPHDAGAFTFDVSKLTCAGNMGCHGVRGQMLVQGDPEIDLETIYRTGLTALSGKESDVISFSGAHHDNYDGLKIDGDHPDFSSSPLAHSYRFIRGLKGYGNEVDRWQNLNSESHNEYFGGWISETLKNADYGSTATDCNRCHTSGSSKSKTARLYVPNRSMTGFCVTCHGAFHSSGATNGTSGAFLRHPSDYVIPNAGEYKAYTSYAISAPVARPASFFADGMSASAEVVPGRDMVMCLSCHMAHASPYDGLLRFDYTALTGGMRAGDGNQTHAGIGCLACHTTKGGPMPVQSGE